MLSRHESKSDIAEQCACVKQINNYVCVRVCVCMCVHIYGVCVHEMLN